PVGVPAYRSGDLLARLVDDVDAFQDRLLRVIPPYATAVLVGLAAVGLVALVLPAAGVILAISLVLSATAGPALPRLLARRTEAGLAATRGALSASVVDLVDGAHDLAAFGALDAKAADVSKLDRAFARAARAGARTTGIGTGMTVLLTGLAMWGALLVGV